MFKRIAFGAALGATTAGVLVARRWWMTWGLVPAEQDRPLPGDDIVPDGETLLTRSIEIDASTDRVWPWLVQMGYGRGGWYSYDVVDMRGDSAVTIHPELQSLEVGDVLPTHPAGGFVVKLVEPAQALVVGLDGETAARQAAAAGSRSMSVQDSPGLVASDRFLRTATPPDFAVSWAFILEPTEGGGTRLIERFRGRFGSSTPGSQALLPILGFGVLVMVRRQLLGIRERAERWAASPDVMAPALEETEESAEPAAAGQVAAA